MVCFNWGPVDEDPPRPTLPKETPANTADGPGDAAPGRAEEEDERAQEQALERSVDCRSEMLQLWADNDAAQNQKASTPSCNMLCYAVRIFQCARVTVRV